MGLQRILVTGGTGGIGAAIVARLHQDGYEVDFTFHSNEEAAQVLATQLGDGAKAWRCDLADDLTVRRFAEEVEGRNYYGFIHAAGIANDALVPAIDIDSAQQAMSVNFWAYILFCKELIRGMALRRSGRIIAISSIVARRGNKGNSLYAASKAALEAFNRVLAQEYSRRGVTTNAIAPGFVATRMIAHLPDLSERIARSVPAGRAAEPAELAHIVAFLLSAAAGYITGEVITVDGGLSSALGI